MHTVVHEKFIRNTVDSSRKHSSLFLVHIICDTAADIPEPDTHWTAGSRCEVLENGGSVYELSHSGEWVPIENSSGVSDLESITSDELNAIWEAG